MHIRSSFFLALLAVAMVGCTGHMPTSTVSVSELPDVWSGHYKVEPYIQTAAALQSLGHATALERLHAMSQSGKAEGKVIVLCRMLFTKRPGADFRRPGLGEAAFLGGTDYSDWPLEPIEVVDGVPFLITRGYILGGLAEADEWYLRYCETNCDWAGLRYTGKTQQQKRDALNRFVAAPKWKTPLDRYERDFLMKQIQ